MIENHTVRVSDPDPHCLWKLDPEPHLRQNTGAVEAQNGAVQVRGRSKWSPGGSVGQWSQIRITFVRSRIWIRIRIKMKS
jgi:hypothetical protein